MDLTDEQLAALREGGRSVRPSRSQLLAELDEQGLDGEAEALALRITRERGVARAADRITRRSALQRISSGHAAAGAARDGGDDDREGERGDDG